MTGYRTPWSRRYLTRRRGIDPPDVEETRRQELRRWRRHLWNLSQYDPMSVYHAQPLPLAGMQRECPTKSDDEDEPHDKRT
jgi:hypothetical protein